MARRTSWLVLQLACNQVHELIRAVVGAFHLGGQASIAPNDGSGGSVADGAFPGPVDFAQRRGQRSHVSREEAPEGSGGPAARVFGEHRRRIELRVHRHRKQQQAVPGPIAKVALQHGKVRRKPRAYIGQRAARKDEIDGHHFAAQGTRSVRPCWSVSWNSGSAEPMASFSAGTGSATSGAPVGRMWRATDRPLVTAHSNAIRAPGCSADSSASFSARNTISIAGM